LLEDARELEYHLRLQKMERAVLGAEYARLRRASTLDTGSMPEACVPSAIAALLFDCATINGARSIGAPNGTLEAGMPADFFTLDLNDPAIAGASQDDLLSSIVFSASRAAVREVVIGGKPIVSEGQHLIQEEVVERFTDLQRRLWS
jgi:formimidoylglutamate deiminase